MTEPFWFLLSAGFGLAFALMVFAWILARRLDNAGLVDVAGAVASALLAIVYFSLGEGDPTRRALLCGMAAIASGRLALYLWRRVAGRHPQEDGRYAELRAQYPRHPWLMFLGLFLLRAFLIVLLSSPVAMVASNSAVGLGAWEFAGVTLWIIALLGESLADRQLHAFRSQPAHHGKTCRAGLWRYSRHPNYFFHWLLWVAYCVFALGTPDGWITAICPALMLFFLTRVTGIPPTEAQALKSRGDGYRDYQRATSAFVPWFPKRS